MIEVDHALTIVLIERWRPETNTFHLIISKATITLEDVGIITGLLVDGDAVTGSLDYDWNDLCARLLGITPLEGAIRAS